MLHTKFQGHWSVASGEEDFFKVFTIYGHGSHVGHVTQSNRPEYPHPVSSEQENSGIRVAVGDCSVTERWLWRPPYQTGKTVHVHAKHY